MRKLLLLSCLLLPSPVLADRLGGLKAGTDVFLSTQIANYGISGSTVDACMMYLNAGGNVFNKGTETLVPYTVSAFEQGCTNNVSASSITINTTGIYTVIAQAGNRASSANTQITTNIYVNGTRQISCVDQANAVAYSSFRCTAVLSLSAGDNVSQYFLMTGTGSQEFKYEDNTARCMLSVARHR